MLCFYNSAHPKFLYLWLVLLYPMHAIFITPMKLLPIPETSSQILYLYLTSFVSLPCLFLLSHCHVRCQGLTHARLTFGTNLSHFNPSYLIWTKRFSLWSFNSVWSSLSKPGWPTQRILPASVFLVVGPKACANMPILSF